MATPEQQARPWVESVADEHGAVLVAGIAAQIAADQQPDAVAEIAAAMADAERQASPAEQIARGMGYIRATYGGEQ